MHTIKLKISDKVYDKFIAILNKFSKEEIEVIGIDDQFKADQNYLEKELNEVQEGKACYLTLDDLEKRIENTIRKREDNL